MLPSLRPCSGLRSRGVNQTEIERKLLPTPERKAGGGLVLDGGRHNRAKARELGLLPAPMKHDAEHGPQRSDTRWVRPQGKPLNETLWHRGLRGTAILLILVEWMMGYPKRWLLDAALAERALPLTAMPSSRKSQKR